MAYDKKLRDHIRELEQDAKPFGVRLLDCVSTGGCHYKLIWQRPDGIIWHFIIGRTPSDHRSALNSRAQFRRMLRGNDIPVGASARSQAILSG